MAEFTRDEVEDIAHKLEKARLDNIDLTGANLTRASLFRANLTRTDPFG